MGCQKLVWSPLDGLSEHCEVPMDGLSEYCVVPFKVPLAGLLEPHEIPPGWVDSTRLWDAPVSLWLTFQEVTFIVFAFTVFHSSFTLRTYPCTNKKCVDSLIKINHSLVFVIYLLLSLDNSFFKNSDYEGYLSKHGDPSFLLIDTGQISLIPLAKRKVRHTL